MTAELSALSDAAEARVERRAREPRWHESSWLGRFQRNLASHDYVIGSYFVIVFFALLFGDGPGRGHSMRIMAMDFGLFLGGLLLTRGEIIKKTTPWGASANAFIYRMSLFAATFLSYFQLKTILPAVTSRTADASIYALDLRVFGFEPSLLWDRFVNPTTTEWFAFFYFGYFAVLAVHVLPFVFAVNEEKLISQFAIGIFTVFLSAHALYMAVPGYGPYRFLASEFHHELVGGRFWHMVLATVDSAGAQKDIFPSLHTAAPTFFAIYSWRHRDRLPFKYTWPLVAFCVSQIIIATMFLRWHYLIDIFAGLTLATIANLLGAYLTPWEIAHRKRLGVPPIFDPLTFPSPKRFASGAEEPAE